MTTPAVLATASPIVQLIIDTATAVMVGDLDAVEVLDGISERQAYAERSLTVGGTWDPESQSFTSDQTITTSVETRGAGRTVIETTAVSCIAFSGSGGLEFADHREQVSEVLTALADAFRDVHELGGMAVQLHIDSQQWAHVVDTQGGGVMCMFTVAAVALP